MAFHNVRAEQRNDETRLIDPDRNVGQALINNHMPAFADGLVSLSIVAVYYLRCDSRAAHLLTRPCYGCYLLQGRVKPEHRKSASQCRAKSRAAKT